MKNFDYFIKQQIKNYTLWKRVSNLELQSNRNNTFKKLNLKLDEDYKNSNGHGSRTISELVNDWWLSNANSTIVQLYRTSYIRWDDNSVRFDLHVDQHA